jgi:hypothetical protein
MWNTNRVPQADINPLMRILDPVIQPLRPRARNLPEDLPDQQLIVVGGRDSAQQHIQPVDRSTRREPSSWEGEEAPSTPVRPPQSRTRRQTAGRSNNRARTSDAALLSTIRSMLREELQQTQYTQQQPPPQAPAPVYFPPAPAPAPASTAPAAVPTIGGRSLRPLAPAPARAALPRAPAGALRAPPIRGPSGPSVPLSRPGAAVATAAVAAHRTSSLMSQSTKSGSGTAPSTQ